MRSEPLFGTTRMEVYVSTAAVGGGGVRREELEGSRADLGHGCRLGVGESGNI